MKNWFNEARLYYRDRANCNKYLPKTLPAMYLKNNRRLFKHGFWFVKASSK